MPECHIRLNSSQAEFPILRTAMKPGEQDNFVFIKCSKNYFAKEAAKKDRSERDSEVRKQFP